MAETKESKKKDDDAAAAAAAAAATTEEGAAAAAGISPEAQVEIDSLKEKLRLSDSARADAEARANKHAATATAAVNEVDEANFQLVNTAIDTVKANTATLKARYRDALAAQDYDAAADIQAEMSSNAAQLVHLQTGKSAMEEERKNPKKKIEDPIVVSDPVEAMARTLTPRSAAWVRAHPKYVTDKKLNKAMIRAHEDVIDDGVDPDSDEYFDAVEKKLGLRKESGAAAAAEDDAAVSEAAKGKQRSNGTEAAPPAIPAARGSGGGGNAVRLTQDQKDIAASMGMTEEEYGKNLKDLQSEGRITKH